MSSKSTRSRSLILMVGVAILVALAGTWSAGSSPKGHQGRVIVRSVTGRPGTAQPALGPTQKVYIDPATGAIRDPTPEEEKALADAAAASQSVGIAADAVPVPLSSGGEALRVPDDFMTSLVATRNPDGSITLGHGPANGLGTQPASGVTQKKEHANDR